MLQKYIFGFKPCCVQTAFNSKWSVFEIEIRTIINEKIVYCALNLENGPRKCRHLRINFERVRSELRLINEWDKEVKNVILEEFKGYKLVWEDITYYYLRSTDRGLNLETSANKDDLAIDSWGEF